MRENALARYELTRGKMANTNNFISTPKKIEGHLEVTIFGQVKILNQWRGHLFLGKDYLLSLWVSMLNRRVLEAKSLI